jgi:hypothetical protein
MTYPMKSAATRRQDVRLFVFLLTGVLTFASYSFSEPSNQLLDGRYLIQSDGATVKDTRTGLIWMRCSVGQSWDGTDCHGLPKKYSLAAAMRLVTEFNNGNGYAGHTNWRVPTRDELGGLLICFHKAGIVQKQCPTQPVSTVTPDITFPRMPNGAYWTSSRSADGGPVCVFFAVAAQFCFPDADAGIYVRLVHTGQ